MRSRFISALLVALSLLMNANSAFALKIIPGNQFLWGERTLFFYVIYENGEKEVDVPLELFESELKEKDFTIVEFQKRTENMLLKLQRTTPFQDQQDLDAVTSVVNEAWESAFKKDALTMNKNDMGMLERIVNQHPALLPIINLLGFGQLNYGGTTPTPK